ncbi:MAG TPA: YvcK family protein [Limnochordia bacterium]|nr:YvcK family protein [Limnochordia bacterium]
MSARPTFPLFKWLVPGMQVKRWLALLVLGIASFTLGVGLWAQVLGAPALWDEVVRWAARHLSREARQATELLGSLFVLLGILAVIVSVRKLVRSLLAAVWERDVDELVDVVYQRRWLGRGPKLALVGGGTGLSTMLRGLKQHHDNITAVVTVADDGGSSGRLRNELGTLPPGDIRNILVAMADTEPLMQDLFEYRFDAGSGLSGHSFGNLFIAALSRVTGDFETAVAAASRVLAVRGRAVPSSLQSVTLCAEYADGSTGRGESSIPAEGKRIRRVYLDPERPKPSEAALKAIDCAEVIVLGPGSLYTSILPNLLVDGIADAIRRSRALKIYVVNVMTQPGETDGYDAVEHVLALERHVGKGLFTYVLMNSAPIPAELAQRYALGGSAPIPAQTREVSGLGYKSVAKPLVSGHDFARHDPERLAAAIDALIESDRRTGPRKTERNGALVQ